MALSRPLSRRAWVQYRAVVRKEALQTLRDRRLFFMLVGAPLLQTLLFGFAVDFDVDRVPVAVADLDRSAASREELRRLLADGTLRVAGRVESAAAAERALDRGAVSAAVVIPRGFGAGLAAGRAARVQLLIDGTDPVRAGATASAAGRYFAEASARLAERTLAPLGDAITTSELASAGSPGGVTAAAPNLAGAVAALPPRPPGTGAGVKLVPRVLYNPRLATAIYMVPGILAMLLVVVTTIVTAMGLAREREVGTLEQVRVTPIRPFVLLAGKMTPYVGIGLLDTLLAVVGMTWVFGVPVRGPLAVLAAGTLLYLGATLATGLFISTISATQQQSFLGGFLFVMPAVLLSGVMTPVHAMPGWLRAITWANPLRFFAELVRGVLLRGSGFGDLAPQLGMLALHGALLLLLATMRFRRG